LALTGSSTVAPLVQEIAQRYERLHKGVRIDVQSGGSARGIFDARNGEADIGMVSRALHDGERTDLISYLIARDGIGLIVHKDNPIKSLTRAQIIGVFTGHTSNWRDIGGLDAAITVVSKAEGRSTLELFLEHYCLKAEELRPSIIIGDNAQGIKTVAGNTNAIGYVSIGAAETEIEAGMPLRLLPIDGIAACTATVADGTFPILRELNLVTKGAPSGLAADFIAFAASDEVRDLIKELRFVPPK
jgi:phosphate transport system substrate-binding protein